MAIVLAIQKLRHYLIGHKFTVYTDQKSLKFLLYQRLGCKAQQNWISKLIGYDFDIKYWVGRENQVKDALSRKIQFSAITTVTTSELKDIEEEVQKDPKFVSIIRTCWRFKSCMQTMNYGKENCSTRFD